MKTTDLYTLSLNEYLEAASSRSPTPGGGSVSAVTATGAAAMVSMVANLTAGKKGYEPVQEEVRRIQSEAAGLMERLKSATAADMAAFDAFMEVWRLPAADEAQKAARVSAMEQAALEACRPPLQIGWACREILRLARVLAPIGNKSAISDVGVAVYVAEAALRSALLSVEINLPLIHTAEASETLRAERARLLAEAEEDAIVALGAVKSRLG